MQKISQFQIIIKSYATLTLLFIATLIYSQASWQENIVIEGLGENIESPWWADAADFDGDGDLDLACVSGGNLQLVWYENTDGQGNFNSQHLISPGTNGGRHVYAADIDNDGDQDICWANGSYVYWNENIDGAGAFGQDRIVFVANLSALFLSDLDGDGDLDILGSSLSDDSIFWVENMDGLGNFGEKQLITQLAERTRDIYSADVDGDGDMDVMSAAQTDNKVAWYENLDGEGTFGEQIIISDSVEGPSSVSGADFDLDGDIDIVASMALGTSVIWYENRDGLGDFDEGTVISDQVDGAASVRTKDMDGDGDMDVMSSIMWLQKVVWFENMDGTFSDEKIISDIAYASRYSNVADLDGDGDQDVYITSLSDQFFWTENTDGNGNFSNQNQINRLHVKSPNIVESVDLNKDGYLDILFCSSLSGNTAYKIGYYLNDKNGNYPEQKIISSIGGRPDNLKVRDIDGDNNLDILYGRGSTIAWFQYHADDTYSAEKTITTNFSSPDGMDMADLDGDGDLDLVCSSGGYNKIGWFENLDGNGNFSFLNIITTELEEVVRVVCGDFDGDGDQDFAATDEDEYRVIWFENLDGLGTFSDYKVIAEDMERAYDIKAGDIDNDGDLDLVFSAVRNDIIAWSENIGGVDVFGQANIISDDFDAPYSIELTDLDRDGDLDLVSTSEHDNQIAWFENLNGVGSYGIAQIIVDSLSEPKSISVGNLNNHGYIEVLGISTDMNKIAWYEKTSTTSQIIGQILFENDSTHCTENSLPLNDIKVTAQNNVESITTLSLQNGAFQLFPYFLNEYTISAHPNLNFDYNLIPLIDTITIDSLEDIDEVNFCIVPTNSIDDAELKLFVTPPPRPGFETSIRTVLKNIGTNELEGILSLKYDTSKVEFVSIDEPSAIIESGEISMQVSEFGAFSEIVLRIELRVKQPPTNTIEDSLKLLASFEHNGMDLTPDNNIVEECIQLIGSYDPNDIAVKEGPFILENQISDFLHYFIRFQNTGTADAINVLVENEIDENLDISTFELEETSHLGRVTLINDGTAVFDFENIYLPDSTTNELESHGFIAYKIKPKQDIGIGDKIYNQASIFFDFNEAIITNTVVTEVVEPTSTTNLFAQKVKLSPNLTNDIINIQSDIEFKRLVILNTQGILVKEMNPVLDNINVSDLEEGIYYCILTTQDGEKISKSFVKI